jgi:chemotaxis protein methyltransferase CheR
LGLDDYGDYLRLISSDSGEEELQHFVNAITTTKTDFFREREHFDWLSQEIFPSIKQSHLESGRKKIRLWSAGCSSGQEAYSLGMIALDSFRDQLDSNIDLKILGTDVNTEALLIAKMGIYPSEAMSSLGDRPAGAYFKPVMLPEKRASRAETELAKLIEFRKVNLIQEHYPIATKFDVILCRNVLYYFDPAPRQEVLERLSSYLVEGGWLILSLTEIGYKVSGLTKVRGHLFQKKPLNTQVVSNV